MSRFSHATASTKTVNLAGGEAYALSPKLALVTHVLTSMVKDKFYKTADEGVSDLLALIAANDPLFCAKLAIYARREYGLRSVSHVIAGEIAAGVKKEEWTKSFFDKIVYRPDDMIEILAYYYGKGQKNEPNAMRKGFKKAFARFDEYSLAKYRGEGKEVSLIDLVNVVHPAHTEAIAKLVKGELKNTNTWETKISATGGDEDQKQQVWRELLESGKLGYFALLRNLRNILESDPSLAPMVAKALVNEKAIKKSLVMPFRFLSAGDVLREADLDTNALRTVLPALSAAVDISLNNVPKFEGKTLVVLDSSGSMGGQPIKIGSLFAAALFKSNEADLMLFSDDAAYVNFDPTYPTMAISDAMQKEMAMSGTNFHAPFQTASKVYDRIIILSDEQGWMGYNSPKQSFEKYKLRTGANPKVFLFDLAGHGTLQLPEQDVYCLAGFSEKTFDVLKLLETDKKALIRVIEAVEM